METYFLQAFEFLKDQMTTMVANGQVTYLVGSVLISCGVLCMVGRGAKWAAWKSLGLIFRTVSYAFSGSRSGPWMRLFVPYNHEELVKRGELPGQKQINQLVELLIDLSQFTEEERAEIARSFSYSRVGKKPGYRLESPIELENDALHTLKEDGIRDFLRRRIDERNNAGKEDCCPLPSNDEGDSPDPAPEGNEDTIGPAIKEDSAGLGTGYWTNKTEAPKLHDYQQRAIGKMAEKAVSKSVELYKAEDTQVYDPRTYTICQIGSKTRLDLLAIGAVFQFEPARSENWVKTSNNFIRKQSGTTETTCTGSAQVYVVGWQNPQLKPYAAPEPKAVYGTAYKVGDTMRLHEVPVGCKVVSHGLTFTKDHSRVAQTTHATERFYEPFKTTPSVYPNMNAEATILELPAIGVQGACSSAGVVGQSGLVGPTGTPGVAGKPPLKVGDIVKVHEVPVGAKIRYFSDHGLVDYIYTISTRGTDGSIHATRDCDNFPGFFPGNTNVMIVALPPRTI